MTTSAGNDLTDDQKIQQVIEWRVMGNARAEVLASIEDNWPDSDAETLLELADEEIDRQGGWELSAARFLYQRQVEIGEFADAARSLKEIERLSKARQVATPQTAPPMTILSNPNHITSDLNMIDRLLKGGHTVNQAIMAKLEAVILDTLERGDARAKLAAGKLWLTWEAHKLKLKPPPVKRVKHQHTIKSAPITDGNFEERRQGILARIGQGSEDSGGTGAS